MSKQKTFSCSCGWEGSKFKKTGCVTYADEWYVCPECGLDASKIIACNKALNHERAKPSRLRKAQDNAK